MSKLPQVSGARLVRALARAGFVESHGKGSHVMMTYPGDPGRLAVVPVHKGKDIPPGTLRSILKGAGLDVDELKKFL